MTPRAPMQRLQSLAFLARWRAHDRLRYRSPGLAWLLLAAWALAPRSQPRRWRWLLTAHRQSYGAYVERKLIEHLDAVIAYSRRIVKQGSDIDGSSASEFYQRAIVLKEPVVADGALREKGVLLIKFTNSFVYLQRHFDVEALLARFYLVLEPSWSGYAQPPILSWLAYRAPILIQASEARDRALIERIGGNLKALPIGSSDWVDHRVFRPLADCDKDFDAVLVGDGSLTKRMHVYLRAIARTGDPTYRAALVMGNWGHHRERILGLIEHYGVGDRVTVFKRMSQERLNVLLNRSKVNVLLSLKEGSNRALFEGFFAGTPALLLRENVGVNKDYINEHTGLLVDERDLPAKLLYMKAHGPAFTPRAWALEHISYTRSTERIAAALAPIAAKEGLGFSGALYEKVNVPEARYPDDPDGTRRHRLIEAHLGPFALEGVEATGTDTSSAPAWSGIRRDRRAGA